MDTIYKIALIVLILVVLCLLLHVLKINGFLFISKKKAKLFICRPIKNEKRLNIKFAACTGYLRKVMRFKEERKYEISFTGEVRSGSCVLELLNSNKSVVLTKNLNEEATLYLPDLTQKYMLSINFENADGECNIVCK